MSRIKIMKGGKIVKLSTKEQLNAILNKVGYSLLSLLILSFLIYVISPFFGIYITLVKSLLLVTLLSLLRSYWYSRTDYSFIIKLVGYSVFLWFIIGVLYHG